MGLLPVRYAEKAGSTYFEVAKTTLSVSYEIEKKKLLGIIPHSTTARVKIDISNYGLLQHEYQLPHQGEVGAELAQTEEGLYSLLDKTIRSVAQSRIVQATEQEFKEHEQAIFFATAGSFKESTGENPKSREYQALDEITDKLINALQYVTQITSLSREKLEAYQRRATSIDPAADSDNHPRLLQLVSHFVDQNRGEPGEVRDATLEYLTRIEKDSHTTLLHAKSAEIILDEFVPAYVTLRNARESAGALPRDLVSHAFGSAISGGFKGFLFIDLPTEAFARYIFHQELGIPGIAIGAVLQMAWPYLTAPYHRARGQEKFNVGLEKLLDVVNHRLQLCKDEGSVAGLLEARLAERRDENAQLHRSKRQLQAERQKQSDRLDKIESLTPKLVELYSEYKRLSDGQEEIIRAVRRTKRALRDTQVPVEDSEKIIKALALPDLRRDTSGLAAAASQVIRRANELPQYNLQHILRTIESVKRSAELRMTYDDKARSILSLLRSQDSEE